MAPDGGHPARAGRPAYHLGNVRAELMAAARRILERQGKEALSLRAISVQAGVALGTIYHHYPSKHALVAELAVEGFDELTRLMQRAFLERGEEAGLRATGYAYLRFLSERPALYQLMFEAVDQGRREDVLAAEREAFQVIASSILHDAPAPPRADLAEAMAMAIWAWGRGIAALGFSRGRPGEGPQQAAVNSALRGLEALITRTSRTYS